ncbi:unnamed protein product [Caenorhabditis bovis]|uniref:Haloacid dehalogenase-like hydrolase domain-containing protein 2 n=1 Tax=Caenorhabditis bovis TaxID=2654633 RepID=A0A8S1EGW6_9PELO|nr:unnamed protein product [Caenorhabditis bovis]
MTKIGAALIDLSGTLHIEDLAIPGAAAALELLRKHVEVKFVTNTTKESSRKLHDRLVKCGFRIDRSEIFTSLIAARHFIQNHNYRPFFIVDDEAMEEFEGIETNDPNAVVIGLAPRKFNNDTMNTAFRLIKEKNAALVAIHKGRYYQKKDGIHIGPGAYVAGLEYSTGTMAEVIGKPNALFFQLALESVQKSADVKLDCSNVVMIGDDVKDDVGGALNAGMRGILVKTGKYRTGDEDVINEENRNVADSFVEAVQMIIDDNVL